MSTEVQAPAKSADSRLRKRIFLVDDHPLVREWLTQLIDQQPDLTVCGEAGSAPEALAALGCASADLAIVDLSLEDSTGLELIKGLQRLTPIVPVLVLSMHDESLYADRVFRAGARGYVNKRESAQRVVEAVRRVLDGKLYVSERAAETLAVQTAHGQLPGRAAIERLSDRELEVFEKLGQGIGTRQIADDFCVSIKTVQAYCARIKEKLNVGSATELLREAVRWHDAKLSR
ncbi:MAG TPA: response regulator transcription factor [Steroidobacteraceae bacterium]|nr:response regulator transcription factor [Steroidobacteraceae bacterium]